MVTKRTTKLLDVLIRYLPVLTVAAAGIWAIFQFTVVEANKTIALEIDVTGSAGAPLAGDYYGAHIPLTLEISVRNRGDKAVSIVDGVAIFGTELYPDLLDGPPHAIRPYDSFDAVGYNYSTDFGERAYGDSFAFEFFAQAYWLEPGENKSYQALAFGFADEDTLFSYEVYYTVAERCEGVFPFVTCYEFHTRTTEREATAPCPDEHAIPTELGGNIPMCVQHFRATAGSPEAPQPVSLDEMFTRHRMLIYDHHGTLIYRHPASD
jgi:hypothetical protein